MAKALDIGISTYARIEAGGTVATVLQLHDIGRQLGLRPSQILREAEDTLTRLRRDNPHLEVKRRREPRANNGMVDYLAGAALGAIVAGIAVISAKALAGEDE